MSRGVFTAVSSEVSLAQLAERFRQIRELTTALIAPLTPEDCVVQSMPDASPAKWHLAHTTWFFEQFLLAEQTDVEYKIFDPQFSYLFNSYYESVGPRHQRPRRGLLTRPALDKVLAYRRHVDEAMLRLIDRNSSAAQANIIELGLQHEQQHQELLLMDIKHLLSCNPLQPAYRSIETRTAERAHPFPSDPTPLSFIHFQEGIYEIGYRGNDFCFDNEMPRHRVFLQPFALAHRPVTNGEFLQFIRDRGYQRPELWLADGWTTVQNEQWTHPLYWNEDLDAEFSLSGLRDLDPHGPVCHVSFYEADAFARWSQMRLPTEMEWEVAASLEPLDGNVLESGALHPNAISTDRTAATGMSQLFGDVWEWTASAYAPYPGFQPLQGALGEYNGKFMCNQMVLRGGACVTPHSHLRATYRNFYYPYMRWQFSGIRLAKGAGR